MEGRSLKLVCFSPTGTSRAIGRSVARGLGADAVDLVDVTLPDGRARRLVMSADDLLVVAVPVHVGRVPEVAARWLETVEAPGTPAVGIVVYGNREFEDALLELTDILEARGAVPIAAAAFIGEHSYSSAGTPIAVARPDADDLHRAELLGRTVRARLRAVAPDEPAPRLRVPGNRPYRERPPQPAPGCIAAGDACVRCGVCAGVCPMGAIDSVTCSTVRERECILCCACVKSCPQGARGIQAEWLKEVVESLSERCRDRKEPQWFV